MPTLDRTVIQDFRNIALEELEFSRNVNCITGGNGEGKTNLLDSIYYLSMTKSAFSPSDRFVFRHGVESFSIGGTYSMPGGTTSKFAIQVKEGSEKKLTRDDKPYKKISEHIGVLPVVMVSPSDTAMVSESSEERRKFVNAVLSQLSVEYLSAVQQYNRLLLQRNRLLKSGEADEDLLSVFDGRMAAVAVPIFREREEFVRELLPVVADYYSGISGGRERPDIGYRSDLQDGPLEEKMLAHRERDRIMKYTTAGIHRDDFHFTLDGYPIRRCGSQGQQKSFLVALKFAQYDVMKRRYGFPPMLLLDDLFDKLDIDRISRLLKMVAGNDFGQIFISDSNKVRTEGLVRSITSECSFFEASNGHFTRKLNDE